MLDGVLGSERPVLVGLRAVRLKAKSLAASRLWDLRFNPKALRTHNSRLLGPKTILYKAFGLF